MHNTKKKEIVLGKEKFTTEYEYDALSQLVSEIGGINHRYLYDSLGNRMQKDHFLYKVNCLNQLIEAEGSTFTFDANGNLSSKTEGETTWTFRSNPLGQYISMQSGEKKIFCTYDLSGRRLTKKIENKDKLKIFRFFYLGQTELGCLDENGKILQLKIPSDPNDPEHSPIAAIIIRSKLYIPLYDLQGNIACLVDPRKKKVVESYRYSAFGEEEIFNEKGEKIANTRVGNPWRYRGKRVDSETGFIYFGLRYYDPKVGRWISPDPMGEIDGPNLYAFSQNNPVNYTDYFGLATEKNQKKFLDYFYGDSEPFLDCFYGDYEDHCFCDVHRNCKRGGALQEFIFPNLETTIFPEEFFRVRSRSYEVGRKELSNAAIGLINGISTRLEKAKAYAFQMSEQYAQEAKIRLIHNASHSMPLDVLECMIGQCRIPTSPVFLLLNQWKQFAKTHGSESKFLQICHSGGAIHTKNALHLAPKWLRKKIIVLAIAPGQVVPDEMCYQSYNYASKRDFVPSLHALGMIGSLQHHSELIYLEPHEEAPFWDHDFDSPTYRSKIKKHIDNYLKQYGN